MFRTSGHHENRGLYKKFFEKFEFPKKKCGQKWDEKFEKLILRKFFYNKFYLFISNLNVECFQLSFDIQIVHVGQKTTKFQKL